MSGQEPGKPRKGWVRWLFGTDRPVDPAEELSDAFEAVQTSAPTAETPDVVAPEAPHDPWGPIAAEPPLALVRLDGPLQPLRPRVRPEPTPLPEPAPEPEPQVLDVPEAAPEPEPESVPEPEPEPVAATPRQPRLYLPAPLFDDLPPLPPRRRPVLELLLAVVVLALIGAWLAGAHAALLALVAIGVIAAGMWVLAWHPMLIFLAMAFMLGFAPGVQTPVVNISVTFVLSVGIWVAMAVMPECRHRVGWPVLLSGALIVVSAFSVIGNPTTSAALSDYIRWAIATAAVYPLFVLPPEKLAKVGKAFVYGCTVAAVVGIGFVAIDRDGSTLFTLSFFGYQPGQLNSRYVLGNGGPILRLTGTYVDPNLGGLIMTAGLILCLALLRGRRRVLCSGVLVLAIALTLSRADAGSVALAGILLVLFGGISAKVRSTLVALGVVAFAGLISVPAVRVRLGNSFGSKDQGSSARLDALKSMPHQLEGHWFFGRGFGAPELVSQTATAATNFVANAPLLAVYRGGVIVGITFTILMLSAGGFAWRLLRRHDFERASLGAGYLGLMVVAFQLDIPVITLTPAILVLALLLAFLGHPQAVTPDGGKRRRPPTRLLVPPKPQLVPDPGSLTRV